MAETQHAASAADHSYETRDVQIESIVILGVGLIILSVVVMVLTGWLLGYFATRQAAMDMPVSPLAVTHQEPPEPRLEVIPDHVLRELRAEEDTALHTYGWVDRQAGIVRIPIDRAMLLLNERGLPLRVEAPGSRRGGREK